MDVALMTTMQDAILRPAGWALMHFLWQGALVGLLVATLLRLLRTASAQSRYTVACAGLALMLALPLVTAFTVAGEQDVASSAALSSVEQADTQTQRRSSTPVAVERASTSAPVFRERLEPLLPWLLAVWALGVALSTAVHLGGWRRVRGLRRDTQPAPERWQAALDRLMEGLEMARKVTLRASTQIEVPMVVGWLRPAILVPVSTFAGLSPAQLEAILVHELAHIRRRDDLVNLLQMAVETLLFYHPAVWWVSRQIRVERENCCDDVAVRACGSPAAYARALTDLELLRPQATPILTMRAALGADGGSLLARVQRLAGRRQPARHGWLEVVLAGGIATLVALAGTALLWTASPTAAMPPPQPMQATDPEPPAEPAEPEEPEEPEEPAKPAEPEEPIEPEQPAQPAAPVEPQPPRAIVQGDLRETIDELRQVAEKTSYFALTEDDLERLAREGFEGDDLRGLERAGYHNLSLDELTMLAREGLDGDDVREFQRSGFENLSLDELVAFAREGVDGDDLRGLAEAGYESLTMDEVLRLAREGVDGDDVRELQRAGFESLTLDELLAFAREGVDGDDLRGYRESGYANLSADEILSLAREGVDGEDVRELQLAGYDHLSLDELLSLAREGVDGEDVRELREAGLENLSVDELLKLGREGVDGDDVFELREAGLENLTVDELVLLAREGVDGDDVREMRDAGYENLTVGRIVELARYGDF